MSDIWLEVALNGPFGKKRQPNIPISIDDIVSEGIACAEAGASVIHLHAYDNKARPVEDAKIYEEIIVRIREAIDVVVYPTIGFPGTNEARLSPIEALGRRGCLSVAAMDTGSTNLGHRDWVESGHSGVIYANDDDLIRAGLALSVRDGWHPSFAIYEPGFLRNGAAWANRFEGLPTPIYRFLFTDDFTFGVPATTSAFAFYKALFDQHVSCGIPMVAGYGADITPLIPMATEAGWHVRVGLEDLPFGSEKTNIELVCAAGSAIETAGGTLIRAPFPSARTASVYQKNSPLITVVAEPDTITVSSDN